MSKYAAYFRVSTARQGQSDPGLEAQQAAVLRFLPADAVRVADYVEVESGCKSARPQLAAAIALAGSLLVCQARTLLNRRCVPTGA